MAKKEEKKRIVALVENMVSAFNQDVKITNGVSFNQKKEIELYNLYFNSKFADISEEEAINRGLVFFNIVNQVVRTFKRKVNLDRKSISYELKSAISKYLGQAALNEFMDDEDFGNKLNKMIEQVAMYGTIVVRVRKRAKKGSVFEVVDFNKIIWDQNDYEQAPIIITGAMKLNTLLNDSRFYTAELRKQLEKDKVDTQNVLSRINIVELYGDLPKSYRTGDPTDIETEYQYHILALYDGKYYHLFSSQYDDDTFFVYRRNPLENRSMGMSVIGESIQAQIQVNEAQNLFIKELRNITKNVYQTTDEGLDGLILSEIDDDTVIKTAVDTKIDIFPQRQSNFAAIQAYTSQWLSQSMNQSGVNNAALGKGEGSREPVGTRGYKIQEIDDTFGFEAEGIALWLEQVFKKKLLGIIYDTYISSDKEIDELLTDEQLRDFYKYIAKKLLVIFQDENILNGNEIDITEQDIFERLMTGDIELVKEGFVVDRKEFIDKGRINIIGEQDNKEIRRQTLTLLAQYMMQNPQLAQSYGFGVDEVLEKLMELTNTGSFIELSKGLAQMPINPAQTQVGLTGQPTQTNDPLKNNR